ncbi:hypothetical protein V1477_001440 [Vespula maculifrons]|uniref:Transmembrane protein n=1 Tax=Vespula maculifrons TaxID=7453 RepID=A0ABD2CYU1_VESMC
MFPYINWMCNVILSVNLAPLQYIQAIGIAFVFRWFSISLKQYKIQLRKPLNCTSNCTVLKNKFCFILLSDIKYLFRNATNNYLDSIDQENQYHLHNVYLKFYNKSQTTDY